MGRIANGTDRRLLLCLLAAAELEASAEGADVVSGTRDGIANWRTMESRLNALSGYGIPTEFHAYEGLPHGFGLGTDTVAEGWIDAAAFWEARRQTATP